MTHGWKGFLGRGLVALLVAVAIVAPSVQPVRASGPTVTGAGSTWVQIALDQWRADIRQQGYTINYQGDGSSAGRQFFIIGQVDFAASEIPFQPAEVTQLQDEHKSYQYLPDVAGGTSLMYNLHAPDGSRITSLRLDAATAARIFTGAITSWQDPAIQALNPGLQVAETGIIPVIRSDGSGTSAQFSLYLQAQAAGTWNSFVSSYGCAAPCSQWPPFPGSTQQNGSDGVANFVSNDSIGSGAIGYVEAGYAFGRAFPIARLRNASGHFTPEAVDPNNGPKVFSNDVAVALTHATLNADLTQNLAGVYVAPEANAYPMSSYSYMITQTTGFDAAKGNVLGTWLIYIACGGQQEATPLGYSPLPPNLVADVFGAVRRLPGAPTPPPIDAQHCPNPTVASTAGSTTTSHGSGGSSGSGGNAGSAASNPSSAGSASAAGATGAPGATSASGASAAPASAGPTAAAGPTVAPGTVLLPSGAELIPPSAAQREALALAADQVAARAASRPELPLGMAALAVVVIVFGPVLVRRRPRRAPEDRSDVA